MFMLADEDFVLKLADANKTMDRGRAYALGRIGIIVPHGSALKADADLKDVAAALKDGRLQKFAMCTTLCMRRTVLAQKSVRAALEFVCA